MDSNHDKMIQNHLCYRYTTRQSRAVHSRRESAGGNQFLQGKTTRPAFLLLEKNGARGKVTAL